MNKRYVTSVIVLGVIGIIIVLGINPTGEAFGRFDPNDHGDTRFIPQENLDLGEDLVLDNQIAELFKKECSDTDFGKNYFVRGDTEGYGITNKKVGYVSNSDFCISSNNGFPLVVNKCTKGEGESCAIAEYYCGEEGLVKSVYIPCKGNCDDGKCSS